MNSRKLRLYEEILYIATHQDCRWEKEKEALILILKKDLGEEATIPETKL